MMNDERRHNHSLEASAARRFKFGIKAQLP